MKPLLLVPFLFMLASCVTKTWDLIRVDRVGPVEVEIWRNNSTKLCESRIYLDSLYFRKDVICNVNSKGTPSKIRGYTIPGEPESYYPSTVSTTDTGDTTKSGIR